MLDSQYEETVTEVGFAEYCQAKCKENPSCSYFIHRLSDRTCWLKEDSITAIHPTDAIHLLGVRDVGRTVVNLAT